MQTLARLRAGELTGVTQLKLCERLTEFPREIFELADTLEVLDLSNNALTALPHDLPRLRRLRIFFGSGNPFTDLPPVLGNCPQLTMAGFRGCRIAEIPAEALAPGLRWLILTDNQIETLPDSIGRCARLQKLMLAGNRLTTLPEPLIECDRLELLRLSANHLPELPDWLLTLPRLSWLACAGNPLNVAREAAALRLSAVPAMNWSDIRLIAKLGEGASGIVHRADYSGAGFRSEVAVKMFKNAVTSDGLPSSEMAASFSAGDHPSLIPITGRVDGHPQDQAGSVMALLDPSYRVLASPPDFDSCTRDVYADEAMFDWPAVRAISTCIAGAAAHLHRTGILNGDLYAHNVLYDGCGHAVLSDLGAASLYDTGERKRGYAFQRLDVRAFGVLLEELGQRCESAPADFRRLTAACLSENPPERPLFAEAEAVLNTL